MDSQKSYKFYDGSSDVRKFVTKTDLEASLKNHEGEKKAQYIASKLVGPAMDVYLRLSDEKKKDPSELKAELLKEFERGQLNREEAISELDSRKRLVDESAETFAYKVIELVKLAYPLFAADAQDSLAKDYFVRGLASDVQVSLKSVSNCSTLDTRATAKETVRLELAGVGVKKSSNSATEVNSCDDMVEKISDRVLQKLGDVKMSDNDDSNAACVGNIRNQRRNQRGNVNRNRGRGRGMQSGANQSQPPRACRSCKSTSHLIRDCPQRFCQACGGRGHDQFSQSCPNYQP